MNQLVFAFVAGALVANAAGLQEYNRAWLLLGQGQRADAIKAAKSIVAQDPRFFRAYKLIALANWDMRSPNADESYFRELTKADGSNPWPYYGLGKSQELQGNRVAARQLYSDCVKRSRDAYPCYADLGTTSDDERVLRRSLPPVADPLCRILARATFYQTARRLPDAIAAVRTTLTTLDKQASDELNADFHELLGDLLSGRNRDYGESLSDFERAYDAWTRLGDWEAQERLLVDILGTLFRTGQHAAAQPWQAKFRALIRERPSAHSESILLENLASVRLASGDPDGALALFLEDRRVLESINMRLDRVLLSIGSIYNRRGDVEAALKCFHQAYDFSDRDVDRAYVLRTIGVLYSQHGDYFKALEYGRRSVKIFRELKMRLQAGAGLRNLAEVYGVLGDFTEAYALVQEALQSAHLRNDTGEEQGCLAALGALNSQMGRPQRALLNLKSALVLSGHTSYSAARVDTLLSLSGVYRQTGDLGLASRYARDGLDAARSIAAPAQEAQALIESADIQRMLGDLATASVEFGSALEIARKIDSPDLLIAAHRGLAEISLKAAHYADAITHLESAVDRLESMRSKTPGAELRSSFVSQNWRVYEDLLYSLSSLHEDRRAFDYSERGRARAFLDILSGADAANARTQAEPSDLAAVERQMQAMHAVLLDYVLGERNSYLWVVSGQRTQMFRLPGRSRITAQVKAYREAISTPPGSRDNRYRDQARQLYVLLCGNADETLRGASKVMVVPDGILHYLPFETLIGSTGRYLVESVTIAYAPSASVLAQMDRNHPRDQRLDLAGFGSTAVPQTSVNYMAQVVRAVYTRAGYSFAPLLHAEDELKRVAGFFPPQRTKLWLGESATKTAVKNAKLADYKRLHFATHTIFDERFPNRSGIVLTPSADGLDDGVLRATDILKLGLDADLVVLSACQTGLGKLVKGEGVDGLSSAFLRAGAARVVVSDWEVNDLASRDFMTEFYDGIARNLSPSEALRQAKLRMLGLGAPAYRHPYYWAPFVLIGNF